jgi:hypothetical protein
MDVFLAPEKNLTTHCLLLPRPPLVERTCTVRPQAHHERLTGSHLQQPLQERQTAGYALLYLRQHALLLEGS